jgi:predicted Zn-dependent protease
MNKTYLFVSLMILAFAAVWLYQKWAVKKAAMKMMEIRQTGSEEEFIQALDSGYAKFSFNDFTRNMMKLNYWIEKGRGDEIERLIPEIEKVRMDEKQTAAVLSRLFGWYVENGNVKKAASARDKLYKLLKGKTDDYSLGLLHEADQVDAVYLRKDLSYIPVLESMISEINNPEQKAVYQYRLAKLYRAAGRTEDAVSVLKEAYAQSAGAQKKKLEMLSMHPEQLDN